MGRVFLGDMGLLADGRLPPNEGSNDAQAIARGAHDVRSGHGGRAGAFIGDGERCLVTWRASPFTRLERRPVLFGGSLSIKAGANAIPPIRVFGHEDEAARRALRARNWIT
jgi:hypothetical protein